MFRPKRWFLLKGGKSKKGMEERNELERTVEYLYKNRKGNLPIPIVKENKAPVFPHREGVANVWTWERALRFEGWGEYQFGILLKDIVVIDFDSKGSTEVWMKKFPILRECPMETTKKGVHFYLGRTRECDEGWIYDKSRGLCMDGEVLDIDIKTRCSTGTRGVIVCAPSKNKRWVRPIWEGIPDIPNELCEFLKLIRTRKEKVSKGRGVIPYACGISKELQEVCEGLLKEKIGDKDSICVSQYENNLYFRTNGERKCPYGEKHKSNNFFINLSSDGRVWYKCLSCECIHKKQTHIGYYIDPVIRKTITEPCVDDNYVEIFMKQYSGRFEKYRYDGGFYQYNGVRWKEVDDMEVYMDIKGTAKQILETQMRLLMGEKVENDLSSGIGSDKRAEKDKMLSEAYKRLMKALSYISKHRNMENIKQATKNFMYTAGFRNNLDSDPYLLGVENGVINLKTMELMEGTQKQNISQSVGYEFFSEPEDYDEVVNEAFERFIEQIYPVEEEREFAQKWFGYCLFGKSPEKYLVFLTDQRRGYNGKSKFIQLFRATMGQDYSMVAKKENIYKAEKTDGKNGHDASMMSFKGKRMAVMEELDPTKVLDDQWIKDNMGGNTTVSARGVHEKSAQTFEFMTKLIIGVNKGNMPQFDMTDNVLTQRFLTIPHRSKFCTKEEMETKYKGVPYTYEADPFVYENFEQWRPYCLLWLLKGLMRYWETRINGTIPAGCKEYLKTIVEANDKIAQFVKENVEKSEDKNDYVTLSELYALYGEQYGDLQRDKRTKIKKTDFLEKLQDLLGYESYHERIQIKNDRVRGCFVGIKHVCCFGGEEI